MEGGTRACWEYGAEVRGELSAFLVNIPVTCQAQLSAGGEPGPRLALVCPKLHYVISLEKYSQLD